MQKIVHIFFYSCCIPALFSFISSKSDFSKLRYQHSHRQLRKLSIINYKFPENYILFISVANFTRTSAIHYFHVLALVVRKSIHISCRPTLMTGCKIMEKYYNLTTVELSTFKHFCCYWPVLAGLFPNSFICYGRTAASVCSIN